MTSVFQSAEFISRASFELCSVGIISINRSHFCDHLKQKHREEHLSLRMASSTIDRANFKMVEVPSTILMHKQTINGPLPITSSEINQLTSKGHHVFLHLLNEEFTSLEKSLVQPSEGIVSEANIIEKITEIRGNLRHPWRHLSLFEHHVDSICMSSWMVSEGRLISEHLEDTYLISFEVSSFGDFHRLVESGGINAFDRHHGSKSWQIIGPHVWHLDHQEISTMEVIKVSGNITDVYNIGTWERNCIWDYHLCYSIENILASTDKNQFAECIRDAVHHAGTYILATSSPMSLACKQGIIDICLASRITIKPPASDIGKRFRGHSDHQAYIMQWIEETISRGDQRKIDHPCVPSIYHDIQMEEADDDINDGNI